MNCEVCTQLMRLNYLETNLSELKTQFLKDFDGNNEDHKELRNAINEIKLSSKDTSSDIKIMKNDMKQIMVLLSQMEADTKELESAPKKKYDAIYIGVVTSAVTILIAFIWSYIST